MTKIPLATAPNGWIWAWPKDDSRIAAHLVELRAEKPVGTRTICGRNCGEPRILSFQVGGYSATPCKTCLRLGESKREVNP